jgi:hypothetical protein
VRGASVGDAAPQAGSSFADFLAANSASHLVPQLPEKPQQVEVEVEVEEVLELSGEQSLLLGAEVELVEDEDSGGETATVAAASEPSRQGEADDSDVIEFVDMDGGGGGDGLPDADEDFEIVEDESFSIRDTTPTATTARPPGLTIRAAPSPSSAPSLLGELPGLPGGGGQRRVAAAPTYRSSADEIGELRYAAAAATYRSTAAELDALADSLEISGASDLEQSATSFELVDEDEDVAPATATAAAAAAGPLTEQRVEEIVSWLGARAVRADRLRHRHRRRHRRACGP